MARPKLARRFEPRYGVSQAALDVEANYVAREFEDYQLLAASDQESKRVRSDCSGEHGKLIPEKVEFDGRIWFPTDGDDAGHRCAQSLSVRLVPFRFVHWPRLKQGEQPTDCGGYDLQVLTI